MTVIELKRIIADLPDIMDVMIFQESDEFALSMAVHANVRPVKFKDEHLPEDQHPTENCLVITDEL